MRNKIRTVIDPGPVQVVCGSTLCRLRVWNDDEWAALQETERPNHAVQVAGLGWVGGVPTVQLN